MTKRWSPESKEAGPVTREHLLDYMAHLATRSRKDGPDLFEKRCPDCKTLFFDLFFGDVGCPLCKTGIYSKAE
jgi:phage FluMu protein Com